MKDFLLTGEGVVTRSWIDENDHMNVMWYTHVADMATRSLLKAMNLSGDGSTVDFVAARVTTAHRREILPGGLWQSKSGLSAVSPTSLTCSHKIFGSGFLAARSEITLVPFDKASRCSSKFSDEVVAKATHFLIDGLASHS